MLPATGPKQIQRWVCFLPICRTQQHVKTGSQTGSTSTFLSLPGRKLFFSDVRGALLFLEADLEHIRKGWPRNHGLQSRWCYPSLRCTIPASQHVLRLTEEEWEAKRAKEAREGKHSE